MIIGPDRFTEQAQEAISVSQQILNRYRHNQWDCEHILLALVEQEKGVPAEILNELGINVDALHERLHRLLEGSKIKGEGSNQIYATPRLEDMFGRADFEAKRLNDEYIGTEHILAVSYTHLTLPTKRIV